MQRLFLVLLVLLLTAGLSYGQQQWTLLQEYPAPEDWSQGLYYDGKVLWNVAWDSATGAHTVYSLNPYNLAIETVYSSPIPQPWGITKVHGIFWMTEGSQNGSPYGELVKLQSRTDSLLVDTTWAFPGYYFYGISYEVATNRLWVATMNASFLRFWMEFNPDSGEVIAWHPWPAEWTLGLQTFQGKLYANTSDWYYPDYTYVVDIDTFGLIQDVYTTPNANPGGIATNGVVWWISYCRDDYHCIQKLIPPGATVHDIAAHTVLVPPSGHLQMLSFNPVGRFINYGSSEEQEVPFKCRIKDDSTELFIYSNSQVYHPTIQPEETVDITFDLTPQLELNRHYTVYFNSDLLWDDYHQNDSMHVHVNTDSIGPIHDLEILQILEPDTTEAQEPLYPAVEVKNTGDFTEPTAPVQLKVHQPNGQTATLNASVSNLSPGEIDTVTFSLYTPLQEGEYLFSFDGLLPNDANPANDLDSVTSRIGVVHDVAVVQITNPLPVMPLAPIIPKAYISNVGDFVESFFMCQCAIYDSTDQEVYLNQTMVYWLDPGQETLMEFFNFIPQNSGYYRFVFCTLLPGDEHPYNDTLETTSSVGLVWDARPLQILVPGNTLTPQPFNPQVIIKNIGNMDLENIFTTCRIDTGSGWLYELQSPPAALIPNQTDTVTFPLIILQSSGDYRFQFITACSLDINPNNDTLACWSALPLAADVGRNQTVTEFKLEGGFPNPFNARTTFTLSLPLPSAVSLKVYSLEGKLVRVQDFGMMSSGIHPLSIDAGDLPSGIYIVRLLAGEWNQSLKLVLLK